MIKLLPLLSCLFIMFSSVVWSQQDFNNFKPLVSKGDIPEDFFVRTSSKVEQDMQNQKEDLTQKEQKIFLEGVHYGIDEILQSGLVIYGDDISNYVTKVANKLLEKEPKLRNELRFYTIKSNVTNAFSTDQGIIVVTTGLISQITSEAHLAYILAHEITHYTEKHVVEGFEYRTRNKGVNSQIEQLSIYSKEIEFEADSLGIKLFNNAGYSRNYLTSTFDVLMYSYLPIDELKFPKDYYNNNLCFVPKFIFADKDYEIKVEEDYDDSRSSHPNVRRRKDKATSIAVTYKNWGEVSNHFGDKEFYYTRALARFERIRTDIINYQYANALYTIFILEKEYPNSLYLHRMKAQCWYGLSIVKHANRINRSVMTNKEMEGEGAAMHAFIKNLKEPQLASLAARIVEDCRLAFPEDAELKELGKRTNYALFESDNFVLSKYKKIDFTTAMEKVIDADTLRVDAEVADSLETKKLSKYDRIRIKTTGEITSASIDSNDFHYYIIPDLIENDDFLKLYGEYQDNIEREEKLEREYSAMSRSERKKHLENKQSERITGLEEFVLVDPAVISYKKGKIDLPGSEAMEEKFIDGFEFVTDQLDIRMTTIGKGNLDKTGTVGFNNKSFFTSMLIQMSIADDLDVFPVDYSQIDKIKDEFGTNKLVFSVVEHSYRPQISPSALYFILFPPGFLAYLPVPFIKGNETELNLIVIDLDKGKVITGANYYFQEPLNQFSIEARLYDIFHQKKK